MLGNDFTRATRAKRGAVACLTAALLLLTPLSALAVPANLTAADFWATVGTGYEMILGGFSSSLANLANVLTAVAGLTDRLLASVGQALGDFLTGFGRGIAALLQLIAQRWQKFLGGGELAPAEEKTVILDAATRDALRRQIEAEIRRQLPAGGTAGEPSDAGSSLGVVIVPGVGGAADDELINELKQTFSDQVRITPDETGRSGIITPVFKQPPAEGYLYVLTPVKPK